MYISHVGVRCRAGFDGTRGVAIPAPGLREVLRQVVGHSRTGRAVESPNIFFQQNISLFIKGCEIVYGFRCLGGFRVMVRISRLEGHCELFASSFWFRCGLSLGLGLRSCISRLFITLGVVSITGCRGTLKKITALSDASVSGLTDLCRQCLGVMLVNVRVITFPQHVRCTNGLELRLCTGRRGLRFAFITLVGIRSSKRSL